MKAKAEKKKGAGRDYSGLSITALAFGTMLSVAVLAIGCGENIGSADQQRVANAPTVSQPDRIVTPSAPDRGETVVLPASAEPATTPVELSEPVTFDSAELAYNEGRYQDATRLFANYVAANQENAWGFYMLGLSSWKSGERVAAEKAFAQALKLDGGHVKSWVNMGRVLMELERPDEALAKADTALTIEPASNAALRVRGRALGELGRADDAIASYMDALGVNEEDAWSMNNIGLINIQEERFEDALPPLARAVELRDDVAAFYNNLGIALERTGYVEDARSAFSSAVSLNPEHTRAAENLARVEQFAIDSLSPRVDLGQLAVEFADEILRWVEGVDVEDEGQQETETTTAQDSPGAGAEAATAGEDATGADATGEGGGAAGTEHVGSENDEVER